MPLRVGALEARAALGLMRFSGGLAQLLLGSAVAALERLEDDGDGAAPATFPHLSATLLQPLCTYLSHLRVLVAVFVHFD